jgi:hypothetical protein
MANYTQRVIWTALPNGREGEFLLLTALVSPRLNVLNAPFDTLDKWPDFLDWASIVRRARFRVEYAGTLMEAETVSQPDPAIWQALFTPTTGVHNHQFEDKRGARVLSYPVTAVHDYVGQIYGEMGVQAGDELPDKQDLLALCRLLASSDDSEDLQKDVLNQLGRDGSRHELKGVHGAFTLQEVYHMPLAPIDVDAGKYENLPPDDPRNDARWRQHKFTKLPGPMDFADRFDFHAIVSALNQYPHLLRLTGLAVDLKVNEQVAPAGPLVGGLSLHVEWNPTPETQSGVETLKDGQPVTITRRQDPLFAAEPKDSSTPISDGLLVIDNERLRLIQMDVDGAGIKLRNMARNLLRSVTSASIQKEAPDRSGAPTLRTAGLQLVEVDRHLDLHKAFERSGEMNDALSAGDPIELYAEDLVRGYHADILDQTSNTPWRSLCRRDGSYDLLNLSQTLKTIDEEGIIRLGAQEAIDQSELQFKNLLKISELLFNWSGWSLTAPRFGLAIGIDDTPQSAENTAPPGLPLEVNYCVRPGSLPPLRFGHHYRARVRLVDLAGNALPLREGDRSIPHQASDGQIFRRYEPVLPPVNALVEDAGHLDRPDEGESMGRMAIRSFNENTPDNLVPSGERTWRHVIPPRTSQVMAEQHSMLDDASGHPRSDLYTLLATRDENLDEVDVLHADPLTGTSENMKYSKGAVDLRLPYLPDPLAKVAVLRLDFDPKEQPTLRVEVPYYNASVWPDAVPFKILIFEDAAAQVGYDPSTSTVHVPLAKADVMRVRISHAIDKADLDLMAVWDLMIRRPGMTAALKAALKDMALKGEHWMLTPWLEMELVHAVQKPLVIPQFLSLGATRPLHDTTARINYLTPIHAKSTDKVELMGHWREPSDIPSEGEPRVLNQAGAAFEERLTRGSCPNGMLRTSGPHAFGDTRYRRVTYRMEAPTRFREFMPPAIRQKPEQMKVVSKPGVAHVPNSSPPPAPEIVEITPTFGWTRAKHSQGVSSFRSGGGLRVWLRRPWFSTGFGEMLGVLVASKDMTVADITGPKARFVTQWGVDPIWRSGTISSPSPKLNAFPLRLTGGPIPADRSPEFVPDEERELENPFRRLNELDLPESEGTQVDVAAHPVSYDPIRKLYYCDILVRPGSSYYPFIRLALARFHPISTEKAHLSPAVATDYMQLAPDRLLVMGTGDKSGARKLRLYGHSYTRSPYQEEHPQADSSTVIRVEIQKKNPNLEGDIAWQVVKSPAYDPKKLYPILSKEKAPILKLAEIEGFKGVFTDKKLESLLQYEPVLPLIREITIKPPAKKSGEEWRVLVMEYERHVVDSDRTEVDKDAVDPSLRLVYAEALAL